MGKNVQVQRDRMAVGELFVKTGAALDGRKFVAGEYVEVVDKIV